MKLIDATELLKNETPAKMFSPEMLVVGKGHILAALEAASNKNAAIESLAELHSALIRYEADVDPTGERLRVDPPPTCSDFWGCVAATVDSITKALPELYQSDGYSRIELTKQLDRLVDIIERAAHPMMKIDGKNVERRQPEGDNNL